MRRAMVLAWALGLVATMTASKVEAQQQIFHMTASLSGANETPGVLTGAYGTAEVTVNMAARTVAYTVHVFNMPSGTTAGHFHVGGPGLAGPVVVDIAPTPNLSNDFVVSGTATSADLRARGDQGIRSWEDFLQALVGGQTYLNVHSAVNPGGEIRGQVVLLP